MKSPTSALLPYPLRHFWLITLSSNARIRRAIWDLPSKNEEKLIAFISPRLKVFSSNGGGRVSPVLQTNICTSFSFHIHNVLCPPLAVQTLRFRPLPQSTCVRARLSVSLQYWPILKREIRNEKRIWFVRCRSTFNQPQTTKGWMTIHPLSGTSSSG